MTPIFDPTESLISNRIQLSTLDATTLRQMQPWLTLSLAPDWPEYALAAATEAGNAVLISDNATSTPIGAAVAILNAPVEGAATISFIAIEPARRYRGLGGEATLALERYLRKRFDIAKVYAPIPDWRGLAVYFWLRQGYRPLTAVEAPWPLTGLVGEPRPGIWMLRDRP